MDPKACLLRADQAASDLNFEECESALIDYQRWRAKGGFEPLDVVGKRGDAFHRATAQRAADAARTYAALFQNMADATVFS